VEPALIRIVVFLLILQIVTPQGGAARVAVVGEQNQRSSSADENQAKQVRELMNAAANGDNEKVFEILDGGLSINVRFERDDSELSGRTVLMIASLRGYENLVEALIKRGADVNLKHYSGDTALMMAAGSPNAKIVRMLLEAGADPKIKVVSPHAGEITPLIRAIILVDDQHRIEIVEALLAAGAEINPSGIFMMSPLMHAGSDLEIVKLLISKGADVNQKNFRGATALMSAAGAGTVSVVKYLIEKGADVNARDQEGNTALTYAENRRGLLDASERDQIIRVLKENHSARQATLKSGGSTSKRSIIS
jgi:uncharacterized protein